MYAVFRSFSPFLAPTLRILRLSLPLRTIMQMPCNFRNNLTFLKICPVDLGGNFPLIAPLWTNCKTPPAPHLALLCALATKWHTTHRKFYIWQTDKHWSVLNQCSFFLILLLTFFLDFYKIFILFLQEALSKWYETVTKAHDELSLWLRAAVGRRLRRAHNESSRSWCEGTRRQFDLGIPKGSGR